MPSAIFHKKKKATPANRAVSDIPKERQQNPLMANNIEIKVIVLGEISVYNNGIVRQ
jgi:hypothetical protein